MSAAVIPIHTFMAAVKRLSLSNSVYAKIIHFMDVALWQHGNSLGTLHKEFLEEIK
jgi:hypothetical protein